MHLLAISIDWLLRMKSILLCREKKDTIVEFAFQGMENPMGVATYKISPDMPDSLKQVLPNAEALKKLLE